MFSHVVIADVSEMQMDYSVTFIFLHIFKILWLISLIFDHNCGHQSIKSMALLESPCLSVQNFDKI